MSTGCPVTCAAGEQVCHVPATCDTCSGYSYCSSYSCPVYCSNDEVMCHDATTMTDSCHPKSAGCPITCSTGEHVCTTPPSCETCDGYNWCSSHPCPVYCAAHEVMCHDPMTMTDSCHNKTAGCPVTCPAGDHVCHSPPPCENCDGYNWCSSYACPVYCAADEVMLPAAQSHVQQVNRCAMFQRRAILAVATATARPTAAPSIAAVTK
ncbi:unnamed protein product [Effrenium voratum]|uniref:Uncharacterized protein n=1 Tax=Effrenium voratum TaxID=2562239 RepID=A0AA36I0C9_9DINO|nr:unnamed protein product [Effrenium voratum]